MINILKNKRTVFIKIIFFILVIPVFFTGCNSDLFQSFQDCYKTEIILPLPNAGECAAGARENSLTGCPDGGLDSYSFHVKDRRADAGDTSLYFYQIEADKIAVSQNFVIFRDAAESARMTSTEADDILTFLENKSVYSSLKNVYGADKAPDVQNSGRVVILVYDIKDDYHSINNPSFIGGFFAPRDLFANDFTSSLWDHPENINNEQYGNLSSIESAANLKGYSNENQVLYMDIYPFYDGTASGDKPASVQLFKESILHEASHLFTYYKRVIDGRVRNNLTWIAEGIAEQAPDLLADETSSQNERMDQYSLPLVQTLLADGPSLLDMNASGNALVGYLQSNLFFNYLRHRTGSKSGAMDLLEEIVREDDYAVTGVEDVLGLKLSTNFSDIFGEWVITNWLSASGRDITSYKDSDGIEIVLGDGTYPSKKYDLSYAGVGISSKGGAAPAFNDNSLPLCYEGMRCVSPASYLYFEYTPASSENYIPLNEGMQSGLKLVLVHLNSNETDAEVQFYNVDSTIPLTGGEKYHLIVYNPLYTGECIDSGMFPWDSRNMAKWIGGGKTGWQVVPGATSKNADKYFYRGRATAIIRNGDGNFIYTADSLSHSVAKWDMDTGTYVGRFGSNITATDCDGDSSVADGWIYRSGKMVNNYCRRSLSSPQGVAVHSNGDVYIADTLNHRIVKVDKDGAFVAWLGHNTDDTWQTEGGIAPMSFSDLSSAGYSTKTKMFQNPWSIVIDESNDLFYVSCYGSNRVVRRKISDGSYQGFIGNGKDGWNTIETDYSGNMSNFRNYFKKPRGIAIDDKYIYIADEENHRISRWTLDGMNWEDTTEDVSKIWMGGEQDGWHDGDTDAGADQGRKSFHYPGDVFVYGDYLYIADRKNQRVVRWDRESGAFNGWIGGGVTQWETEKDGPPQEPVGGAYEYPSIFMLEPVGLSIASDSEHLYMYVTTVYNGRVSRWNLDCVADNINGDCYDN